MFYRLISLYKVKLRCFIVYENIVGVLFASYKNAVFNVVCDYLVENNFVL